MKRIAAALLCLLLLTGCRGAGPADGTTDTAATAQTTTAQADHHVILHTAAGDFTPNLRPLGSRHNNVFADALPIFPQDAAAALTEEDWVTLPVTFAAGLTLCLLFSRLLHTAYAALSRRFARETVKT